MIVPLIPLFLAASINVNDVDWQYGPEAIYNVQVDATAYLQNSSLQAATTNSTLKLMCRLESELVLNCRFREIRHVFAYSEPGEFRVTRNNDDFGQDGPGEESFQLHFCPAGIREIVVTSSIDQHRLDMIRALVGQLNVGTELSERENELRFDAMETSAVGVCNAICDLTTQRKIVDERFRNDLEIDSYELVNIGEAAYDDLEFREFEKIRNLDYCLYRTNYFYGSREAGRKTLSDIGTMITSSRSKMAMTKTEFTSYTENMITVSGKYRSDGNTIITERIILSLADIVPAEGPIPKIVNASRASVFPTLGLRENRSEESHDNE